MDHRGVSRSSRRTTFRKRRRVLTSPIVLAIPRMRAARAERPSTAERPRAVSVFRDPRVARSPARSQVRPWLKLKNARQSEEVKVMSTITSRPPLFVEVRIDLRHQNRAERELSGLGFSRQTAQISTGGSDRGAALQNTRDDDRSGGFAQNRLRLFPGAGTDSEHRSNYRSGGKEIPPVPNPALGVIGDVRASTQHHSQRIGPFRHSRCLRFWLSPRRPAFSKARFKINKGICI